MKGERSVHLFPKPVHEEAPAVQRKKLHTSMKHDLVTSLRSNLTRIVSIFYKLKLTFYKYGFIKRELEQLYLGYFT
jgi:hypothetical protein